ncbi:hypothetical protein C8J57DRAFT_1343724 [Mycena rebaudengoi]|nr:hypothetical protein C8J57DRAFT_1343724 [Mycena rebaudengoi]
MILREILKRPAQSTSELLDALDTIAVTLLERRDLDNALLRHFLDTEWDAPSFFGIWANTDTCLIEKAGIGVGCTSSFFDTTWPRCVEIALEMPQLFPGRYLRLLTSEHFLCTLPKLSWVPTNEEENSQDLHIWYAGDQPHLKAVSAYLTALFTFFERVASDTMPSPSISLTLHTAPSTPHIDTELLTPSVDTSLLGLPSGACVISANSHIGFGRTASQEEMHVGCTPQSLPAKLFIPPLKDNEVMVLRGCEAVVELVGYGRTAELSAIIPVGKKHSCSTRTMLFMDALELDGYDMSASTADLLPGNVDRELTKAYTAFASYPGCAPHWGCRAFGGNREIKSIIQWSAARMAGVHLNFVCDKSDSFASDFRSFTSQALSRRWTVYRVIGVLRGMRPTDEGRLSAFHTVCSVLNGQ